MHTRSAARKVVILPLVVLALAAPAWAQPITEDLEMYPNDGVAGDKFGFSIDIEGDFAAIGAIGDDDKGSDSGSAYLFDLSIDAVHGAKKFKVLASDGTADDNFGFDVALHNGLMGVGAPADTPSGLYSGSAYLYNASTGAEIIKLLPFDGGQYHQFGRSIAIDSGVIAVGAPGADGNNLGSGAVYLFFANTSTQYAKLIASDGQSQDGFGSAIAISGGIIAIGAGGNDNTFRNENGAVYLFDVSTGLELMKIIPNDTATEDHFGSTLAMSNGVLAVGAWGNDDAGSMSGSAYLFDASTGAQNAKLLPNDGGIHQRFGISIAIDGDRVSVGTEGDDDNGINSGSAYLFNTITGSQTKKLLASDGTTSDWFGGAIAVREDTVLAGSWHHNSQGDDSGAVFVYEVDCPADLNNDGYLDNGDINLFIALFLAQSPLVDFNNDGFWDNGDINAFIALFLAGC